MTAEIIQIRDYQNKRDIDRLYQEITLEQQATEIMSVVVLGHDETSAEYVAPTDDPA